MSLMHKKSSHKKALPMRWTQVATNPLIAQIASAAKPLYKDPRRTYHSLEHIRRMFDWAHHLGIPYDVELDKGIWGHDVILDYLGNHEARSKAWLLAVDPSAEKAGDLIMTTKDHCLGSDNRLILLDLADFLNPAQRQQNTSDLFVELSAYMPHLNREDLAKGMHAYLSAMRVRMEESMHAPYTVLDAVYVADEKTLFADIFKGIDQTILALSSTT